MFPVVLSDLFSVATIYLSVLIPVVAINSRLDKAAQKRSPEEIWKRTVRDVEELVAWYHSQLSRDAALSIGACYARYSTKDQDSVCDQLRKMFERAIELRVFIPAENVFFDLATSAKKMRRKGLQCLKDLLRTKKVKTLLLFNTHRLFRKQYRTLEFVDQVHRTWNIRCIFVASGIDTNDKKQWAAQLQLHSMLDEFSVLLYADNVRAAHEGLMLKRLVFGTISFGYLGEVIPGELTLRGKPRRRLVIDPTAAAVVKLIFTMFVKERLTLNEIARRLNGDSSIALHERCSGGRWTNDIVRRILTNTRYRALWRYGVTESVYLTDADYFRKNIRSEPLKVVQIEELRIISDEEWYAAAELIAKHNRGGRKPSDGNQKTRSKVLNGLLYCEKHNRPLVVSGANGSHMVCPVCQCLPSRKRALLSWLNRSVALDLLCKDLARRITADDALTDQIVDACRRQAGQHQRPAPGSLDRLKGELNRLARSIDFNLKNPGETEMDLAESSRAVRELRADRARVEAEIHRVSSALKKKVKVPSQADVRRVLTDLACLLTSAARSDDPADRAGVRVLVEELTGDRIIVSQQGERKKQNGWLRGTFQLRLLSTVMNRISDGAIACDDDGTEISIDFKRPLSIDAKSEIAWRMFQDKKRHAEIGEVLDCAGSYVTRLLKYYAKKNGLTWVDGRSLRLEFPHLNRKPALFKRLVEKVMALFKKDVPLGEIAKACEVHVATVRKAIKWHHEQNELEVPSGRARAGRIKRDRNRDANT